MQKAIIGIVIIIILGLGGWALTKNNNLNNNTNNQQTSSNTNTAPKNPIATNAVTIQNFAFSPQNITVAKGTTVTWTNKDSTAHQPVADSGTGPQSPILDPGKSYSFTYNQVGTFHYHCAIHPEMTGTVTVTDTSSASPQSSTPANNTTPAQNNTNQGSPY